MIRIPALFAAVMTLLLCDVANGDVFKCVAASGAISFAQSPCPTYVGESSVQRPPPSRLSSEWEETDFPYRLNKNATEILQVSRRRKLIITNEREIADRLQSIRPPSARAAFHLHRAAVRQRLLRSFRWPGSSARQKRPDEILGKLTAHRCSPLAACRLRLAAHPYFSIL